MGVSLVYTRKIEKDLPDKLKHLLEKRFRVPCLLDRDNISYLEGLVDAGYPEAKELIEAINKYDEIELEYR